MPRGWRHQIKNVLVLNYNLGLEKQILKVYNLLLLQAQSCINTGTLFTHISVGSNVVLGRFNSSFSFEEKKF
jgi:lipid A 3-O-deacylase